MAKKKNEKPLDIQNNTTSDKTEVVFIKDFKGQLNNNKFDVKKDVKLEVQSFLVGWLKSHGAIE